MHHNMYCIVNKDFLMIFPESPGQPGDGRSLHISQLDTPSPVHQQRSKVTFIGLTMFYVGSVAQLIAC